MRIPPYITIAASVAQLLVFAAACGPRGADSNSESAGSGESGTGTIGTDTERRPTCDAPAFPIGQACLSGPFRVDEPIAPMLGVGYFSSQQRATVVALSSSNDRLLVVEWTDQALEVISEVTVPDAPVGVPGLIHVGDFTRDGQGDVVVSTDRRISLFSGGRDGLLTHESTMRLEPKTIDGVGYPTFSLESSGSHELLVNRSTHAEVWRLDDNFVWIASAGPAAPPCGSLEMSVPLSVVNRPENFGERFI